MKRFATLALCVALGRASADTAPPPTVSAPTPTLRLRGASAHEAARFLAATWRVDLVMVGSDAEIDLDLAPATVDEAFAGIARAAGLAVQRRGNTFLLAPAATLARPLPPQRSKRASDRMVSLDFYRVQLERVYAFLHEVLHRPHVASGAVGELTIVTRHWPAAALLALVDALAPPSENHALPPAGTAAREPPCAVSPEPNLPYHTLLPCVAATEIDLAGLVEQGVRHLALLRERRAPKTRAAPVHVGDLVGRQPARVDAIGSDGVTLSGGVRLALPTLGARR